MKKFKTWLSIGALLAVAVGCSTTKEKENMLSAAGFQMVPANTPQTQAHLKSLPADKITTAFIFGSLARNEESGGSDVDVLIIGDLGFAEAVGLLYPAQAAVGREINPQVFNAGEWRKKVKAKDPFAMDVLAKPKIFLIGNEDEFAKPGRRQS